MKRVIAVWVWMVCYVYIDSVLRDVLKLSGQLAPQKIEDLRFTFGIAYGLLAATHASFLSRPRR